VIAGLAGLPALLAGRCGDGADGVADAYDQAAPGMIERTVIHVGGPPCAGKTAFIEALIRANATTAVAVARCARDDRVDVVVESSSPDDPEILRYEVAGAVAAARITFASRAPEPASMLPSRLALGPGPAADAFYDTDLMNAWSDVVIVEGDDPLGYADLRVFIAPPPPDGGTLFEERIVDRAQDDRVRAERWKLLLNEPGGLARWADEAVGIPGLGESDSPGLASVRSVLLTGIERARKAPPRPEPVWSVAAPYPGIEHAGLVVVNVRDEAERANAARLVADVIRLRKEPELFTGILSWRGNRTPITAVVADLLGRGDAGRRKALSRARRSMRRNV
jgi:hypothetical protein